MYHIVHTLSLYAGAQPGSRFLSRRGFRKLSFQRDREPREPGGTYNWSALPVSFMLGTVSRRRFENLDADRQQRLFDSAAEEFGARGYDAASLNRILERSGMSKSSLY